MPIKAGHFDPPGTSVFFLKTKKRKRKNNSWKLQGGEACHFGAPSFNWCQGELGWAPSFNPRESNPIRCPGHTPSQTWTGTQTGFIHHTSHNHNCNQLHMLVDSNHLHTYIYIKKNDCNLSPTRSMNLPLSPHLHLQLVQIKQHGISISRGPRDFSGA